MAKKKRATRGAGKKPAKKSSKKPAKKPAKKAKKSAKKAAKTAPKKAAKKPAKKAAKKPARSAAKKTAKKAAAKSAKPKAPARIKAAAPPKPVAPRAADKATDGNNKAAYEAPKVSPLRGATVDEFITSLPEWQRDIVQVIRKLVRDTAPDSQEAMKWGQPVFEVNGPFCYLKPFTTYVNFGFWRGNDLPDPRNLLEGGGERMRHVKLTNANEVPSEALASFIRLSAELNRACGSPAIPQATQTEV